MEMRVLERNGIDMEKYLESFDSQSLFSLMQYLEVTEADKELEGYLRLRLTPPEKYEAGEGDIKLARGPNDEESRAIAAGVSSDCAEKKDRSAARPRRGRRGKGRKKQEKPTFVWGKIKVSDGLIPIGPCACGGVLAGVHVQHCEFQESGRFYYKECNTCEYYREVLIIDGKFIERGEGG